MDKEKARVCHFWNGKGVDARTVDSGWPLSRELKPDAELGLRYKDIPAACGKE